jgi:hypothetical protein
MTSQLSVYLKHHDSLSYLLPKPPHRLTRFPRLAFCQFLPYRDLDSTMNALSLFLTAQGMRKKSGRIACMQGTDHGLGGCKRKKKRVMDKRVAGES